MYNNIGMNFSKSIKIFALLALFTGIKMSPALAEGRVILAFGDSLTAGYGLAPEDGFTRQLEQALRQQGRDIHVVNGGVSGETTSGGLSRLEWLLSTMTDKPDLVIMELGANDALRGISPDITRDNMAGMLAILEKANITTLVAGMIAPPNMGPEYGARFNRIFPELSAQYHDALYPFFLEDVAGNARLNQKDALHPTAEGVAVIVKKIIPHILKALEQPVIRK